MKIKNKTIGELREYLRVMEDRGDGKSAKANHIRGKIRRLGERL